MRPRCMAWLRHRVWLAGLACACAAWGLTGCSAAGVSRLTCGKPPQHTWAMAPELEVVNLCDGRLRWTRGDGVPGVAAMAVSGASVLVVCSRTMRRSSVRAQLRACHVRQRVVHADIRAEYGMNGGERDGPPHRHAGSYQPQLRPGGSCLALGAYQCGDAGAVAEACFGAVSDQNAGSFR